MSTSAPGAPPAAGQAAPQPASTAPAGAQGPGQGVGSPNDGFWGNFPDVPEGQRELLEPHLKNVQGHVTKMEQQYSPYKGLTEVVSPDQVQNLVQFLQNYSQDPVATWLGLAQSLQEEGHVGNPEFNVETLQQMLQAPQQQADPNMPEWAQSMQQKLQAFEYAEQQRTQQSEAQAAQEEARQQEAMLQEAHQTMAQQLQQAGVPEGLVTPEQMTGALIAHEGDIPSAVGSFTGLREGFLKGFTESNGNQPPPATVRGDAPKAPKGGLRPKSGDGFRSASVGAQQFLAQGAAAAGQE